MMNKPTYNCGLSAAMGVVGGKWKLLVIGGLMAGPRRFGELRRSIDGISEKMLLQQLRELEADGAVSRHDFGELPPRVAYALTDFGLSLIEALKPLCEWGSIHMERIVATKGATAGV